MDLSALLEPAEAFLEPSKRIFAPFLLASTLIAAAALAGRGLPSRKIARQLFDRRVWLHPSALTDYRLIALKAVLRAFVFSTFALSTLAVAAICCGWLRRHVGDSPLAKDSLSAVTVAALFTLAAFLAEDWSRYAMHRAMHRVPWLWSFHKIHHGAEVMTPLTLYRTHPVEAFFNNLRGALAVGMVSGAGAWFFGPKVRGWELLGVDAIGFLWSLLGANLRHSHVWVSYGPRWERLLMSPAQHQIHHSADRDHADRNFGTVLSLWDWLGGSLRTTTRTPEPLRFGLSDESSTRTSSAIMMILTPFRDALRHLRPTFAPTLLLAACAMLLLGCASKKFDRAALLSALGENSLAVYQRFATEATALAAATEAYATTPSEPTRVAAQTAWNKAIRTWQEAEMLRFGPLAPVASPGGRALRDHIYAWPLVTRCFIEQHLVAKTYETQIETLGTDTRGLAAIEYLLFYSGSDNQCGTTSPINAEGTWAALGAVERERRKAAYAHAAAVDIVTRAQELISAWEPNGFLNDLKTAGRGSVLLSTQQTAFNTVAEALFYADTELKDRKLAVPLGLKECPIAACSTTPESEWAGAGKQHLRANLLGMRVLLEGAATAAEGNTLGFDDYLESLGATMIAAQTRLDLSLALDAVDALDDVPLTRILIDDAAKLQTVYERVKALTDFLKMEFTATLEIQPPTRVEGDHD